MIFQNGKEVGGMEQANASYIDLADRVVIVTGASRGIGASIARTFVGYGARVTLAARSGEDIARIAGELGEDKALPVVTDVSDEAAVQRLVEQTLTRFGRLDGAVNNAAGSGRLVAPIILADVSADDFDRTIAVNLRGVFLGMKYQIPAMLASGGGAIVNISSTAGVRGARGLASYVASKHGVGGLTKTAALDYAAQGIRVNAIAPGPILNDRIAALPEAVQRQIADAVPMKRIGRPEEVANLAAWLCSDLASYVTGASIAIDGGQLAGPT
jgi:NAD(P)-dependent dehydrogenase (short-subunit alcohol dehydrogenase family)